ncbi:LysR family transcriptional regulator [Pseudorhizobium banfieldiae]
MGAAEVEGKCVAVVAVCVLLIPPFTHRTEMAHCHPVPTTYEGVAGHPFPSGCDQPRLRKIQGGSPLTSLRKLRTVLYAAELGQVSAAARALNISQPAASRAILSVEKMIGTPLFQRGTSRLTTTEQGMALCRRTRRALDHLETADAAVTPAPDAARRLISAQTSENELQAVIAIAECGTITAAARREGLSQPALTRSLRKLENRVGQALFHRTTERMRLTPAGETLVRRAKLAFSELRHGFEEVALIQGARGGELRLGALPLTRARLVPFAIDAVLTTFPEARVSVVDGTYSSLATSLRNGDIDMIVGSIRAAPPGTDLSSQWLFDDSMVAVARTGHPLAGNAAPSLAACLRHDWVLPLPGVPLRMEFEALIDSAGLPRPGHVIEADSLAIVRTLLLGSDRLAVVSHHQVHYETSAGQLVVLPVDFSAAVRPVGWTVRRDYIPTSLMQAFQQELRRAVSRITSTDNHHTRDMI